MKRNRTSQVFAGSTRSSRSRGTRPLAVRARRFFQPLLEQFEDRRLLATVTVNTTSDVSDGTTTSIAALLTSPGTDGVISLREAIIAANNTANVDGPDADSDPDPDAIHFNIPGGGVKSITPTTALPAVTQAVVIDGYTQPGASANTLSVGSDAVLLVELVGGAGPGNGLLISADSSTVRGLVINRFGSAIYVQSGGNTIEGNWLGIDDDGNTRLANVYDVFVANSPASANNLIGGTNPGSRNVMAGTINDNAGIMLFPGGGSATIQGNYIGMNAHGTDGIGASGRIYLGTPGNLVGGTAPGAGNVISGRAMEVYSSGNTVQGNTFGLNASGTGTLANNLNGIFIRSHSSPTDNNLIGGTTSEARNVFATSGTAIDVANSTGPNVGNRIQGNYFGTNKAGIAPAGMINPSISGTAIRLNGGMNNLVGGTTPGAGNVIANFANGSGIEVLGSNNTIQGNRIGTNAAGTAAIPNGTGIYVGNYVSNNLIGGSAPGAGNVISGNNNDGMLIGPAGTFNTIQGNLIGVAADGIFPLGNGAAGGNPALRNGIRVEGSDNLIGGTGPGEGNTVAFNFGSGVLLPFTNVLAGSGFRNSVLGNSIYSNGGLGIDIFGGGVTVNDLNDTDAGTNDIQNFPVITSGTTSGSTTTIQGTLNSTANSTFRVELFASVAADGSGFGEGQTYLGFVTVTTNASSTGSFSFTPTVTVPVGQFITGTATGPNGSTSELSAVRVVVVPPNQPPTITSNGGGDSAGVNVPENLTAVTTVTATDPDSGMTMAYSIAGGADASRFTISATTGALAFVAAPNFEAPTDADTNNSYVVIVQASDGSLADLQMLTVTVTNANELPVITSNGGGSSASVSLLENTTAVTTVMAFDPDAGTTIVYSISGGADAAQFAINPSSGALTFVAAPNFEAPTDTGADNAYEVIVAASDGSLADSQALTVTVTNANEPPVITSNGGGDSASVSIPENTTEVTTVATTDPDVGTTIAYSISGGADAALFAINPFSGTLTLIAAPNFESPSDADGSSSYLVIVQVSDGSLTDSQALTVSVTNANELPAITSNGGGDSASIGVPENTTAVTTVTATDPDAETTIVYSISGGVDAAMFSINASNGALAFITAPNFEAPTDSDGNNSFLVIVQASDGSLSDSQALTVTVANANEPPTITSDGAGDAASISVPENTTVVTTFAATDPDAGMTLTYSIGGGADADRFSIDATSGALAFVTAPNFETPTDADSNDSYLVIVQSSDGSLSDSQTLTVTVTNVNELPVITSDGGGMTASLSVPENTTAVTTVTATDPDAATTLTYSISAGADAARFTINAATGVLAFVTAPNFENPTDAGGNNVYDVIVEVSDGSLLDRQAISVNVTDVAEADYTISERVFKDVTGNGKSADDLPWSLSPAVTLNLYRDVNSDGVYQSSDTWLASTATGSGGVYSFDAPAVGKYLIKEVVPSGFVRTFPVLSDFAAVNLTGAASTGSDWYNAEVCDLSVVTNVSYVINHGGVLTTVTDLRGNTHEGDIVTANFTVIAAHQFTLVTYNAPGPAWDPATASQQTVFDFQTATFAPGSHTLIVEIPKNFYQIDFGCGAYISQLGPAGSNIFYSAQNRLISADNSGVNALGAPAIDLALSTTVDNPSPLLGSNVVITVQVSNAAGWSTATGVRVKDALPTGLTFVSALATQGTYNSNSGEWNLVNPLNSGAAATLTITAIVSTAGEKKNAAQVTAAGAPDIDSTPNNDSSPSTPHNEDDDDSVSIVPQLWTKYFVVNDSSSGSNREKTFEYASDGTGIENYQLGSGNTSPRGAATTAAGNQVWVIDANKTVYVYDAGGTLLGSWSAGGLASNATPEGIATNGTDIWIVDARQDKVFKYANAASRTSGGQNAASSFALNSGNRNPKDIVASSTHLWVVGDSSTDKVFKYTLAGACVGSWTISGGGGSPTGITLDPANVNHLWIVDKSTDRVYQFNAAASRTSGSQSAASSFPLASGNTSPEGIADPPPAAKQVAATTPARSSAPTSNAQAFDVALLAVIDEINGLSGNSRKKRQ